VIALATNVLARILLEDEPDQARRARRLLAEEGATFWVPITVILELAWVLRSSGLTREAIAGAVRGLLALSGKAERFATFDEALVKQARNAGALPAVEAQ